MACVVQGIRIGRALAADARQRRSAAGRNRQIGLSRCRDNAVGRAARDPPTPSGAKHSSRVWYPCRLLLAAAVIQPRDARHMLAWDSEACRSRARTLSGACSGITGQLIPGGIAVPPSSGIAATCGRRGRPLGSVQRSVNCRSRRALPRSECLREGCKHCARSGDERVPPRWRPGPGPRRNLG